MTKHVNFLILLLSFTSFSFAQTVTIGNQVWTSNNLSTAKFRNGDPIIEAKTDAEWVTAGENGQPAWCYYKNIPGNGVKYGKLYNWFAVNDSRGLAPAGFHIPTDEEWTALTNYLGGEENASKKMKASLGWFNNGNGNNSSGFSGLPGGYRDDNGVFGNVGEGGSWWSSSESSESSTPEAWGRSLDYSLSIADRNDFIKQIGFSVRCLKGEAKIKAQNSESFYDDRDGKTYRTVNIGNQTWMASNLAYKPSSGNYYINNNDISNLSQYGYLYDWSTACNVCPSGWKLPTDAEWTTLTNYLGGENIAGKKMKSTSGWYQNGNGSNDSGFSGLPGGYRSLNGDFTSFGYGAGWWSSSAGSPIGGWGLFMNYKDGSVIRNNYDKQHGFSVRCLRLNYLPR
jgi:uncharacterized protein (TIGR02145 family)